MKRFGADPGRIYTNAVFSAFAVRTGLILLLWGAFGQLYFDSGFFDAKFVVLCGLAVLLYLGLEFATVVNAMRSRFVIDEIQHRHFTEERERERIVEEERERERIVAEVSELQAEIQRLMRKTASIKSIKAMRRGIPEEEPEEEEGSQ